MERKRTIRAGIIGSGFAADFHFEAVQRVYGVKVEVVGAYSRNPERLNEFCHKKGVKTYGNIEELINASDVIHLCTPPVTHEPLAIQILKKNKNVIIEKQLTGYFGNEENDLSGTNFPREKGLEAALQSIKKMLSAERRKNTSVDKRYNYSYIVGSTIF